MCNLLDMGALDEYLWEILEGEDIEIRADKAITVTWDRFEDPGDYPSGAGGGPLADGAWMIEDIDCLFSVIFSVPKEWVREMGEGWVFVFYDEDENEEVVEFIKKGDMGEEIAKRVYEIVWEKMTYPSRDGDIHNNLYEDYYVVFGLVDVEIVDMEAIVRIEAHLESRED